LHLVTTGPNSHGARLLFSFLLCLLVAGPAAAQQPPAPTPTSTVPVSGGAFNGKSGRFVQVEPGHWHYEERVDFDLGTGVKLFADAADKLPPAQSAPRCRSTRALFAFARSGEDLSFSSTDWNQGISPWNFNVNANPWRVRPLTVSTVFDRTLFRTGETVGMKHIARVPAGKGFRIPAANELPRNAEIQHLGSGQKYRIEAKFDAQGVADGTWKIPREAKLLAIGLGHDISGPTKRTDERRSINHYKRRVTVHAQEWR